jgi:hypothetical protein
LPRQALDETQIWGGFVAKDVGALAELIQVGLDPSDTASSVDIEFIRSESVQLEVAQPACQLLIIFKLVAKDT